jgi:hypothetical protein
MKLGTAMTTTSTTKEPHKRLYRLPQQSFESAKNILDWCTATFGPRRYGGPWEYNAVYHDVVIYGDKNIMLFELRWL